ncbi:MAG: transglycosylase SLT domain-containing protein [Chloroflexota bacterium]
MNIVSRLLSSLSRTQKTTQSPFSINVLVILITALILTGLTVSVRSCGNAPARIEGDVTTLPTPGPVATTALDAESVPTQDVSDSSEPVVHIAQNDATAQAIAADIKVELQTDVSGDTIVVEPNNSAPQSTPIPVSSSQKLDTALRLHRYGNYVAERTLLSSLIVDNALEDPLATVQARYQLILAYFADTNNAANTNGAVTALTQLFEIDDCPANDEACQTTLIRLRQQSEFLRGSLELRQREYSKAITAYNRFLGHYPTMAESVHPKLAQAYLFLGDQTNAALAYQNAADAARDAGDRVQRARYLEAAAEIYTGAAKYTEAIAAYDEILSVAQNGVYRAGIQNKAAATWSLAGEEGDAIYRWRQATEEDPTSQAAYAALIEIVNREVPFDLYQRGYIDLEANAWIPAINAFEAYRNSADATPELSGKALHGIGQAQMELGNYAAALETLNNVVATYPDCTCIGQAWLDKAYTHAWLGDLITARRTLRTFAREQNNNSEAPEALWQSGMMAYRSGNLQETALDFLALADLFPDSERAPIALSLVAFGLYQRGEVTQAVGIYERLQRDYPDERSAAVGYWLGRSYKVQGEREKANDAWQQVVDASPDVYYGVLSAYGLQGIDVANGQSMQAMGNVAGPKSTLAGDDGSAVFAEQWLASWSGIDVAVLSTMPEGVQSDINLAQARLLLALDQRAEALIALERVYDAYQGDPHALYTLMAEFSKLGVYRLSLKAAVQLMGLSPAKLVEDTPIYVQKFAYPQPFADLIKTEAFAHNLNPLLYFSLIRQESLFEEGARSFAAAQGLAQIIPDTGQWIADRVNYPNYYNELVYRPHINVSFGAYYLNWARNYLDGNLVSALVGYNAGPGNSEAWRAQSGTDDALFVEILTVNEPRLYVRKITEGLYHYTRLYGKE